MEIELNVKKNEVLEEVAKTSSYSGSKMTEDEGAYERIFTTDADREMLERFWSESQVAVCEAMKKFLADEGYHKNRVVSTKTFENTPLSAVCKKKKEKLW